MKSENKILYSVLTSSVTLLLALAPLSAVAAVRYVNANNTTPSPPYDTWATAAANIQDAVDFAFSGDEILVTNGVYRSGGTIGRSWTGTNRVAVTKPLTVRSVNGPEVTVVDGLGTMRCVYLTNEALLVGFTLTNGIADDGGGVYCEAKALVLNCTLSGNWASDNGGGSFYGILSNCTLTGNSASGAGGGIYAGAMQNCTVANNSAEFGGGAYFCSLSNCTITVNSAEFGGGAYYSTLNNCIVYFNTALQAPNYDSYSSLNYSCTTPLPGAGAGNISADPQLTSSSHISAGSPCRGAGNAAFALGADIDGESWANPPSIGCDEVYAGSETGPLMVTLKDAFTKVVKGHQASFTAVIDGYASANRWEFGDGTVVSNRLVATHAWTAAGEYQLIVRAYNVGNPGGVSATATVHVTEPQVHYVAAESMNPVAPYLSWSTAATNIQDAVGAAAVGETVLVSNGVYQGGVTVGKSLSIRSMNGPDATIIDAQQQGRCAYFDESSVVTGFTFTRGSATYTSGDRGGGVYGGALTNCILTGNWAMYGGGAYGTTLDNCVLRGNSAPEGGGGAAYCTLNNCTLTNNYGSYGGGGAYSSTLNNCIVSGNSAHLGNGGGAKGCTLNNCTVSNNSAYEYGGGVSGGVLNNCVVADNSSDEDGGGASSSILNNCTLSGNLSSHGGGGAFYSMLTNCIITGNSAAYDGGGVSFYCTLNNCIVSGNSARGGGGGASGSTLNNCTVTGNSARYDGGGVYSSSLNNCTVYFNSAPHAPNYDSSSALDYCCSTPLPATGVGNISADPQLTSSSHISAVSPCRGAGNPAFASGVDIDGQPWGNPPSIGCDEVYPGSESGALDAALKDPFTNVVKGAVVTFKAQITGQAAANRWEFGDGTVLSNRLVATHTWAAAGDYQLILRAYNQSYPAGVSAAVTVHVTEPQTHYVASGSMNPVAPYLSWATAATSIQNAVDVAVVGELVLVSNGVYKTRTIVAKPLTIQSVNGPDVTVIDGHYGRCVELDSDAVLTGFTLTNGQVETVPAPVYGGGAYGGTLNNCILIGNSAGILAGPGAYGGGAYGVTLNNCIIAGNSATDGGGGVYGGTLNNCTVTGNSGGGASESILNNCIAYFNTAPAAANYDSSSSLNYCCTTPMPTNGIGNFTNEPLFVDYDGGDLRLQSNSPCINAGNNDYVTTSTDLDGNPRISSGRVDVGAYEFVFAPGMDVGQLILMVENSNLPAKNKRPLLVTLAAAAASLDRGNIHAGVNQLAAFENKVRAQVTRIDAELANELIEAAHEVIQQVAGP